MDSRADSFEIAGRQVGRGGAAVRDGRDRPESRRLARSRAGARRRGRARRRAGDQAAVAARRSPRRRELPAAAARQRVVAPRPLRALRARRAGARRIAQRARRLGLGFISTPFDARRRRHAPPPRRRRLQDRERRPDASRADRARGGDRQTARSSRPASARCATWPTRSPARAKPARATSRCCTACRRIRRPTISRISPRFARSRTRSACRSGCPITAATRRAAGDRGGARRVHLRASCQA